MQESISLAQLDDDARTWIEGEAERRGQSVEAVVVDLIKRGLEQERLQVTDNSRAEMPEGESDEWRPEDSAGSRHAIGDMDSTDPAMW